MTATACIAAEKRHAASVGVEATLRIDGVNHSARIIAKRGIAYQADGGAIQQRKLSAVVLCAVLPATRIIDSTTGDNRQVQITHQQTGLVYRLDSGGVTQSPHGVYWSLQCSQVTTQ